MATVRLASFNESAARQMLKEPEVQAYVRVGSNALARDAQRRAAKDTGEGAASIHAEKSPDGIGDRVSWDEAHSYMAYVELGTRTRPARPFLRPAGTAVFGGQ